MSEELDKMLEGVERYGETCSPEQLFDLEVSGTVMDDLLREFIHRLVKSLGPRQVMAMLSKSGLACYTKIERVASGEDDTNAEAFETMISCMGVRWAMKIVTASYGDELTGVK